MKRRIFMSLAGAFAAAQALVLGQTRLKVDQIELVTNAQLRQADIAPNADGTYTKRSTSIIYRNGMLQRPEVDYQVTGLNIIKFDDLIVAAIGTISEVWYG